MLLGLIIYILFVLIFLTLFPHCLPAIHCFSWCHQEVQYWQGGLSKPSVRDSQWQIKKKRKK